MSKIHEELARVQRVLKAPKGQYNSFGNYYFRSCEDILESVKMVTNYPITVEDDIVAINDRFYVKAKATFIDPESSDKIYVTAFAREPQNKKGMDEAQITGSTSSYARKYALNGLFCIDDTRDSDTMNNNEPTQKPKNTTTQKETISTTEKPWYNDLLKHKALMESEIDSKLKTPQQIIDNLKKNYKISKQVEEQIKLLEK